MHGNAKALQCEAPTHLLCATHNKQGEHMEKEVEAVFPPRFALATVSKTTHALSIRWCELAHRYVCTHVCACVCVHADRNACKYDN